MVLAKNKSMWLCLFILFLLIYNSLGKYYYVKNNGFYEQDQVQSCKIGEWL